MAKSKRKKVLGRGLSALLNDTDNDIESVVEKNTENIIGNIICKSPRAQINVDTRSVKCTKRPSITV